MTFTKYTISYLIEFILENISNVARNTFVYAIHCTKSFVFLATRRTIIYPVGEINEPSKACAIYRFTLARIPAGFAGF